MTPLPPRALLFDWDNTLVDTFGVIAECYNAAFRAFGLPEWSEAETRRRAHGSLRDVFPALFGDDWRRAGRIFYARFDEIHLAGLRPMAGAADLLERAAARGLFVGIVSNKTGPNLRAEVRHLGWDRWLGPIVGATDAPRDKPAPDPLLMALGGAPCGAGPEAWMIGDSRPDLLCAHAAGCVPVLVREAGPGDAEFADCPPALHARNCHALGALLASRGNLYL